MAEHRPSREAEEAAAEVAAVEGGEPTAEQLERAALAEATVRHAFGPGFFLGQLRAFARRSCPDPAAGLPVVEVHLADGEVLDLCHVIGVTPNWVALAVNEAVQPTGGRRMRTEFVPYEAIARVTIRPVREESPHIGFEHSWAPRVLGAAGRAEMTPEDAIRTAAAKRERR